MDTDKTYKEKQLNDWVELTFRPDFLDYRVCEWGKSIRGFKVKYENIGPELNYRSIEYNRKKRGYLAILCIVLWVCLYAAYIAGGKPTAESLSTTTALMICFTGLWGYQAYMCLHLRRYTLIPVDQNRNILVPKTGRHDEILAALQSYRLAALKKYAVIDPLMPQQQNLQRLRWLKDQGAISDLELQNFTERLLSGTQTSEAPAPPAGTPILH